MQVVFDYFPELTEQQKKQFIQLQDLYSYWNERINVVSRKDIDQLATRHVLHSLAIAKVISFCPGTKILDIGTGGGFPGIPLAILFPEVKFHLVDSIAKKINVVNEVADGIGLVNCKAEQLRAEKAPGYFDFIVSRAVAPVSKLFMWTRNKFLKKNNNHLKNGYLFLKGGDLEEELSEIKKRPEIINISSSFNDPFFETKKIIYYPMQP